MTFDVSFILAPSKQHVYQLPTYTLCCQKWTGLLFDGPDVCYSHDKPSGLLTVKVEHTVCSNRAIVAMIGPI